MSKKKKKIKGLDRFHYHEALDRTYLITDLMETALMEHPVIQKHKELKKRVEKAQNLLLATYQLIGGLDIKLFPEDQMTDSK